MRHTRGLLVTDDSTNRVHFSALDLYCVFHFKLLVCILSVIQILDVPLKFYSSYGVLFVSQLELCATRWAVSLDWRHQQTCSSGIYRVIVTGVLIGIVGGQKVVTLYFLIAVTLWDAVLWREVFKDGGGMSYCGAQLWWLQIGKCIALIFLNVFFSIYWTQKKTGIHGKMKAVQVLWRRGKALVCLWQCTILTNFLMSS